MPLKPRINLFVDGLKSTNVPFLMSETTLDASESFDPDDLSAELTYKWACPTQFKDSCAMMTTGNKLTFGIMDKVKKIEIYNRAYFFNLTISNP